MERAVLGGGCFWCLEAVFQDIRGVTSVASGYCGGAAAAANYRDVCAGDSGHAEVVAIDFDPSVVAYSDLLRIFFAIHDPTTLNRQGNDVGPQYRSVIFTQSFEQERVVSQVIGEIVWAGWWSGKIVTEVAPAVPFFPAEDEHQQYFKRNPGQGYCAFVIAPKVAKAREMFRLLLKPDV